MARPTGPRLASFLGLVHPGRASPFAAPHLSQAPHPCPLRDHPSKGPSGRPKEVHGGRNSATPGLRNAATPSASAMQVRCLLAGTALKWDAYTGEQKTCPGWDLKAGKPAEEELEMVRAWLHDQDLMMDYNGKELLLEWALCRYWALSKCQFGDTVSEAAWHAFLCCLLPWEDKLVAVQMDIGRVWDPKYHYHLDLTNAVPIQKKLPHLRPKEKAWLDVHLDELVAKEVIGPILPGE